MSGQAPVRKRRVTAIGGTSSSVWNSIVAPIKKLWEVPTIHLSTYYGSPNQPGRPGPVIGVWVERSSTIRQKLKQRQKGKGNKGGHSDRGSKSWTGKPSSNTAGNEPCTPVDIEGVLVVTPQAIERYLLNGAPLKRAALPDTITAFMSGRIAGVGRVFVCGTQNGQVHIMRSDLLDLILVFCTGLSANVPLDWLRQRTVEASSIEKFEFSMKTSKSSHLSDFSYVPAEGRPSGFAHPPVLLPETILKSVVPEPDTVYPSSENIDSFERMLQSTVASFGTVSGDGVTHSLIDSRIRVLKRSYANGELSLDFHALKRLEAVLGAAIPPLARDTSALGGLERLSAIGSDDRFKSSSGHISSLSLKNTFADYCTELFSGTAHGDVYCWYVPSGLLRRIYYSPTSTPTYVQCMKLVKTHEQNQIFFRLWVGYGAGVLAVFDTDADEDGPLTIIDLPGRREAVNAIEYSSSLGLCLVINGNKRLTAINVADYCIVKILFLEEISNSASLSCMALVDKDGLLHEKSTIVFVGCLNGALSVLRLEWSKTAVESVTTLPTISKKASYRPSALINERASSMHSPVSVPSKVSESVRELKSTLLTIIAREQPGSIEVPPVSSLWIDLSLDTVFLGDASGVVITIVPIRYLLDSHTAVPSSVSQKGLE